MSTTSRAWRSFVLGLAITLAAPSAGAQQRRPGGAAVDAAQKKREGDDAFRALRYTEALRAYEAAYALAANPALHYNRGRALEALERFPEAVDELEAFEREAPPDLRARASAVAEHIRELKKKVATVRLVVKPEGARILLRDIIVGTAPLSGPIRVTAGMARLEVEAEGYVPYEEAYGLPGDAETTLTVTLAPKPVVMTAPIAPPPSPESHPESKSILGRWWFWTAASAVVVGAAVVTYAVTRPSQEPREGDVGRIAAPLLRF